MKNIALILILGASFAALATKAQNMANRQLGLSTEAKYANVVGSLYLDDNWTAGQVKLANGKIVRDLNLKYDLLNDMLIFKKDNEGYQFQDKVVDFDLIKDGNIRYFKSGFIDPRNKIDQNKYFEILTEGNTRLLRRTHKNILDTKSYNSATITKNIETITKFYAAKADNQLIEVKTNKKALAELFGDKAAKLEEYITSNKLNIKEADDLIKTFRFYNDLK